MHIRSVHVYIVTVYIVWACTVLYIVYVCMYVCFSIHRSIVPLYAYTCVQSPEKQDCMSSYIIT